VVDGGSDPGLLIVAIILIGILSGVFTATESAAVAVIYALVLTLFIYRSLSWRISSRPPPRR